jgi:PAS domain S-box-containing protein
LANNLEKTFFLGMSNQRENHQSLVLQPERLYREVVENANSIILRMDTSGNITFFNRFAQNFLGYTEPEILGKNVIDTIVPPTETSGRNLKRMIQELIKHPESYQQNENENTRRNGERVWVAWTNKPLLNSQGEIEEILCIGNDITQRVQIENDLRKSEARYRAIVEDQIEMICRFLADGTLTFVNRAYSQYFGKEPEELIGTQLYPLIPEADQERIRKHFQSLNLENPVASIEYEIKLPDGGIEWHHWTNRALFDEAGEFIEYQSVGRDITELKKTQAALEKMNAELESYVKERTTALQVANEQLQLEIIYRQQAEQALKQQRNFVSVILDTAGVLVVVLDRQGRIIRFNKTCEQTTGYTTEEVLGECFWNLFLLPDQLEAVQAEFQKLCIGQFPSQYENYWVSRTGNRRLIAWSNTALTNAEGQVEYVISSGLDITERHQTEENLRKSEEFLRTIISNAPITLWAFDRDGIFTFLEGNTLEQLELQAGELVGKSIFEQYKNVPQVIENTRRSLAGEAFTSIVELKGVALECWYRPLQNAAGQVTSVIGAAFDVTERKQAQEAIERERRLFMGGPVTVFRWRNEENWPVEYVSANVRQWGYHPQHLMSGRILYGNMMHPEDRQKVSRELRENNQAGICFYEQDYRIICADGQVSWVYDFTYVVRNEYGEVTHYEGYVLDITERKKVEEALRKSEAKTRTLLSAIPDLIFRIRSDGTYLDVKTPKNNHLLAYSTEQIGHNIYDVLPAPVAEQRMYYIQQALLTGELQIFEFQLPYSGQNQRHYEARIVVSGEDEVLTIIRDITERKQAEKELQEAKDHLQAVLDAVPGYVSWIDRNFKYLGVNRYLANSFKKSPEEFVGEELGFMKSAGGIREFIERLFESSDSEASEEIEILAAGKKRYSLLVAQKYLQGQAIVCVGIDITDRKQVQEALLQSEAKFSTAFRSSPSPISISTLHEGRYLDVNESCLRIFGYQREEVIGHTSKELNLWVNPEEREYLKEQLIQQGSVHNVEVSLRAKNGEIHIGLLSAEVIELNGEACLLSVTNDITERKWAEAQLREKEAQYRSIFEASSDALFITDFQGLIVEVNPAACRMYGYNYEEFIQLSPINILHPDSYHFIDEYLQAMQTQGEYRCQTISLRKDGTSFYVDILGARLTYKGKPHILGIVRDITERVVAEKKLREAQERDQLLSEIALRIRESLDLEDILNTTVLEIRNFLHADRVFIGHLDENFDGLVVAESVADGWSSILGYITPHNVYFGEIKTLFEHKPVRAIDDTEQLNSLSLYIREYYQTFEIRASLAVQIVVNEQAFGLLVVNQCRGSRHWEQFEMELLERLATQVSIAIRQAQLYQQLEAANANLEWQVAERTEQLQHRNQELQEINRLKDLFLHTVTHDLRTPVMGSLMVLKNLLNLPATPSNQIAITRSVLERMIQGSERQLKMINSLLEVHASEVRGVTLEFEAVNMSDLIHEIAAELAPLLEKNQVTWSVNLSKNLPIIQADPSQLWRVFENLIVNALNHNPPGIHLTLTAAIDSASYLHCTIQDNGVGMSQEQSQNLFELYVRGSQNRRSVGLGLGLYMCRQIITAHGGEIGVISTPGQGANFWFTLPINNG